MTPANEQARTVDECGTIRAGCRGSQLKIVLALVSAGIVLTGTIVGFANVSTRADARHDAKLENVDRALARIEKTSERMDDKLSRTEDKIDAVLMKMGEH